MTRKSGYITLLFFLIVASSVCNAQQELTIEDAVRIALEKNVEVNKSANNYTIDKRRLTSSYAQLFPDVSFGGSGSRVTGRNFDQVSGVVRTETGEFVNSSFGADWGILNVLDKFSRIKVSKNNALSKLWGLEDTRDFTVLEVARNYILVLQGQEQRKIVDTFIRTQEINLDRVQQEVELGSRAKQEAFIQKAELSRLKSMRVEALNTVATSKNDLVLLLGLDPDQELLVQDDITIDDNLSELNTKNVDEIYDIALSKRNDLKSMAADMVAKKHQINVNRAAYYPTFSIYYQYGTNYSSFQDGGFKQQFFTDNITQEVGLSVRIPILNGLRTRTNVTEAKLIYENLSLDHENLKKQIFVDITNIINTIAFTQEKINFETDQAEATRVTFELEQEKNRLGAGTAVTLAIAQRDYIEASLQLNQTKFQLIFNQFELDYFCGKVQEKFQ